MDLFEAIRERRSVRRWKDDPVKEEDLLKILDAARLAPSATNEQPWHFIVVRDRDFIRSMGAVVHAMLDARIEVQESTERREAMQRFRVTNTHFENAPVAIAVLTKPWPSYRTDYERQAHDPGLQSVAAAISYIQLAATALGYGACWMTGPVEAAKAELEAMLGVEPPWSFVAMVPIGVPVEKPKARPRRPLEESVTFIG